MVEINGIRQAWSSRDALVEIGQRWYTWWFQIFVEGSSPFRKMSPLSNTPGKTNIEPAPVILPILHGTSEDCPNTVELFQEAPIPSSPAQVARRNRRGLCFDKGCSGDVRICPVLLGCIPVMSSIFRGWHVSNLFVGSISSTFNRNGDYYLETGKIVCHLAEATK